MNGNYSKSIKMSLTTLNNGLNQLPLLQLLLNSIQCNANHDIWIVKVMVTVILSEKGLLNLPPKAKKGRNQRKENLKLPQCQMTLKRNLILRY